MLVGRIIHQNSLITNRLLHNGLTSPLPFVVSFIRISPPSMAPENVERLNEIFRVVFELSSGSDVTELRQVNDPKWDSLAHVSLVTAIESEFGVELDAATQLQMTSYAMIRILLEERGL